MVILINANYEMVSGNHGVYMASVFTDMHPLYVHRNIRQIVRDNLPEYVWNNRNNFTYQIKPYGGNNHG